MYLTVYFLCFYRQHLSWDWRTRGKIITAVLCCIVYDSCEWSGTILQSARETFTKFKI